MKRLSDPRHRGAHARELTDLVAGWAADKERTSVFPEGQSWRIPLGYVPHLDEVRAMAQHQARAFFAPVDQHGTVIEYPTLPFMVDSHRCAVRPAPALGDGELNPVPETRRADRSIGAAASRGSRLTWPTVRSSGGRPLDVLVRSARR